jgi:O-antigen ligase
MLMVYAVRKSQFIVVLIGLLSIGVSLGTAYGLSSSFQNKVENSLEDLSSWGNGKEINFKSMGMRLEAARISVYVIRLNPMGVGAASQDEAMAAAYDELDSVLLEQNRVGPHNQFLEFGVKYGWLGMVLLLVFFVSLIFWAKRSNFSMWGIVAFLFIAVFFESLLERQVSLYFIALLVPLSYHFFAKREIYDAKQDRN